MKPFGGIEAALFPSGERARDTNWPINDPVLSALHGFIILGIFHLLCFCNTPVISCSPIRAHFLIYFVVKGMLLSLSLNDDV